VSVCLEHSSDEKEGWMEVVVFSQSPPHPALEKTRLMMGMKNNTYNLLPALCEHVAYL